MEATLLNLDEYNYSGEGANGASYDHKTDSTVMVKLYNPTMDRSLIESELEIAQKVYNAGIPSPEPGCFVTDGQGRYGIKFRRLVGKVSYARAVGNHPELAEEYGRKFALECKKLHDTTVDTKIFPSVKDQYLDMLKANPYWAEDEKVVIADLINNTPDSATAIHGDLQFGNILEMDGKSFFIDLGEFAYGHPYFDLGMTVICSCFNDEAFTQEAFHMDCKTAYKFFEAFVPVYFDGKYTVQEAIDMLIPYAIIKSLLIERNAGIRMDRFHDMFAKAYRK